MLLAHIALGANLPSPAGPPDATLAAALEQIAKLGRITARSSLYSTEPVGFADQPRFLNAVIAVETDFAPHPLLDALLSIERVFGRDRSTSVPNGPRSLDLDILLYGDLVLTEPALEIPHPRLAERAFVLVPLTEIAPDLRMPPSGLTAAQLLANLPHANELLAPAVLPIQSSLWRTE
jgi:2-amino-4-hydroxy-6-hydroxymethyldihydropteridine diphosphokinase